MSFQIRTAPAGHTFPAAPGETLLTAALRHAVRLPHGCRNGTCGACAVRLLAGRVDYPPGPTADRAAIPAGFCLTCQGVPGSDIVLQVAEVQETARLAVRTLPCRVVRKELLSHDVLRLWLKLPEGQRLMFCAGQYLEFLLRDGRRRAFSIANAPHDDALLELHIRQVPGGAFTEYLFNAMPEKTILRIRAPLGTFVLREASARPLLMIAGGTGFAPLKGMIEHALHVGIARPMRLYWGVRARRDLYLPQLPIAWAQAHADFSYTPVLSAPDTDWTGRTGLVHAAVAADHPDLAAWDVYLSGPPVMVEAGRRAFTAAGLDPEHLFSDAFEYAADAPAQGPG